ncbi:oligosaccharide flippase family protein [Cetobacterium sp. 2A]|uniref:lipopolysaccharide biosynthesis protein n=1 Tax=Cetobacterium sp. 2A TaxID=2754723 RepID=UPI00163B73CF|nr:oligosaccharide flippase family protein [Cetobacterium sp. 2A]MBC2856155.1 oligosaccharide flippase family protein [Cetobacterium sp. 2A]
MKNNIDFVLKKLNKNKLVVNIFSAFIFKGLGIILSFLSVPITLKYLGNEFYGLWILILSITSWIYTFDIGIGNGLKNKIAEGIAKNDNLEIKENIAAGYFGVIGIALIFFIFSFIVLSMINTSKLLNINFLTNLELTNILLINIFFVCLNFVFSLCNNIFYGSQKSYLASLNAILSQFFNIVFLILLIKIEKTSIVMLSIFYGLSVLLSHCILTLMYFSKNSNINFNLKDIHLNKVKKLLHTGGNIFIVQICGLIIFSTDNFIISYFLGMDKVAEYNIVNKLFGIPILILTLVLAPIWPAITKSYYEKDRKWIENLVKKMKKLFILMTVICVGLIFVGKKFIQIWTLDKVNPNFALILTCGIATILTGYSSIYSTPLFAIKTDVKLVWLSIFQAIMNIILSYVFIKFLRLGSTGVILATCFCMATNIFILPRWLNNRLKNIIL